MPIDAADLPALAQLFAPIATANMLGATLPAGVSLPGDLQGDVTKTQAWLSLLDDAAARSLLGNYAVQPVVAAALARLPNAAVAPPPVAPLPAGPWHWVLDDYPAVNRHQFWKHLNDLISPKGKRILLIRGDRQVGKSYTGEYILPELPRRVKTTPIRTVHQRVDGAGSIENVVQRVLSTLGMSMDGAPSLDVQKSSDVAATKEWWVKEMASWFVQRLHSNAGEQIWLALDGHAKNQGNPDLTMFCVEVATLVGRRSYLPNGCRLLLIDYPAAFTVPPKATAREEIKLPTETDVVVFLQARLGASPATNATAAAIWNKVMQQQEMDRMQVLFDELMAVQP